MKLVGPDRELLMKGRRSENMGLGVGAFAYYRQVVENQKNRLLEEIKKIAKLSGAPEDDLEAFDRAINETQFQKAVRDVREAVPRSLFISEQNPLLLLHDALSYGLHAGTDEECLALAHDVRVVLYDLADRISLALRDEADLKLAVSRLMGRRQKKEAQEKSEGLDQK